LVELIFILLGIHADNLQRFVRAFRVLELAGLWVPLPAQLSLSPVETERFVVQSMLLSPEKQKILLLKIHR